MIKRGVKRKQDFMNDENLNLDVEEERRASEEQYDRDLCTFQMMSQRRESMRLKSSTLAASRRFANGQDKKTQESAILKERISREMSLVEGTAKFIMACGNTKQVLEASKSLLASRMRSDMMKFELNRLRRGKVFSPTAAASQCQQSSYASLSLSSIRVPLLWRLRKSSHYSSHKSSTADHLHPDPRTFAVFCLAKMGSQVYESGLVHSVNREMSDVVFSDSDVIYFNKVAPHFEVTVEVYGIDTTSASHLLHATKYNNGGGHNSVSKISKRFKKAVKGLTTISNDFDGQQQKNERRGNRKESVFHSKDFESIGAKFTLIASTTLTLENCCDEVRSHEVYTHDETLLPLFGQFCCQLSATPYSSESEVLGGKVYIRINNEVTIIQKNRRLTRSRSKLGEIQHNIQEAETTQLNDPDVSQTLHLYWASLKDWKLSLWKLRHEADPKKAKKKRIINFNDSELRETEKDSHNEASVVPDVVHLANPDFIVPIDRETYITDKVEDNIVEKKNGNPEKSSSKKSISIYRSYDGDDASPADYVNNHCCSNTPQCFDISIVFPMRDLSENPAADDEKSYQGLDAETWLITLLQHASDHRKWKDVALRKKKNKISCTDILRNRNPKLKSFGIGECLKSPSTSSQFSPQEFTGLSTPTKDTCTSSTLMRRNLASNDLETMVVSRPLPSRVGNGGGVRRTQSLRGGGGGHHESSMRNRFATATSGKVTKKRKLIKRTNSKLVLLYNKE